MKKTIFVLIALATLLTLSIGFANPTGPGDGGGFILGSEDLFKYYFETLDHSWLNF